MPALVLPYNNWACPFSTHGQNGDNVVRNKLGHVDRGDPKDMGVGVWSRDLVRHTHSQFL